MTKDQLDQLDRVERLIAAARDDLNAGELGRARGKLGAALGHCALLRFPNESPAMTRELKRESERSQS